MWTVKLIPAEIGLVPMFNLLRRKTRTKENVPPLVVPSEICLYVEIEQEADGRWIADIEELPGVMSYGATQQEALQKAAVLALRVLADRLEHDEAPVKPAMRLSLIPRECMAGQ